MQNTKSVEVGYSTSEINEIDNELALGLIDDGDAVRLAGTRDEVIDVVESIISIYNYHFILSDQIFSSEELWDFLFTKRDDHFAYHNKIWSTFINDKYYKLFEIIYIALDDPEPEWWNIQFK